MFRTFVAFRSYLLALQKIEGKEINVMLMIHETVTMKTTPRGGEGGGGGLNKYHVFIWAVTLREFYSAGDYTGHLVYNYYERVVLCVAQ